MTNIDRTVDRAVSYALRRRRPVVLGIPYDLVSAEVVTPVVTTGAISTAGSGDAGTQGGIDLNDPATMAALSASVADIPNPVAPAATATPRTPRPSGVAGHQLKSAITALKEAERPLILAGRGAHISGAAAELNELADTLGAVTATTALARGIFSAEQYDLGITGGFGQDRAMAVITEADVVVVVGASLNQFTMRFGELFGPGTTVIRIDDDQVNPPKSKTPITHLLLQGDAKELLGSLLDPLTESDVASSGWRERVAGLEPGGALRTRSDGLEQHPDGLCTDGRLDPRSVATRIGELLPADRHVTTDGGHFIGWANMYWPVTSPERMIMVGTAYQTIGLGFPTVAGVAAAAAGTTVVLSTGDGGGLMALADLETAIRTAPAA
ncbi:thiamine pyrophosphate-binding protein [Leucobacter coleopterorum]|uniref:Thiamine pyrophosphate-binding protein n=1 Tax=Leucobacter coleopterorum TaxID=2714933 RepID=A0ABX6JT57_9MICO|nr:thiamine pyrophosphate-binding protein [Leucobacter coleopterorum]